MSRRRRGYGKDRRMPATLAESFNGLQKIPDRDAPKVIDYQGKNGHRVSLSVASDPHLCRQRKIGYTSSSDARTALEGFGRTREYGHKQRSIYRHGQCGYWHVSSMSQSEYRRMKNERINAQRADSGGVDREIEGS